VKIRGLAAAGMGFVVGLVACAGAGAQANRRLAEDELQRRVWGRSSLDPSDLRSEFRVKVYRENSNLLSSLRYTPFRIPPPVDYDQYTGAGRRPSGGPVGRCQNAARAYVDYMSDFAGDDPDAMSKLIVTRDLVEHCIRYFPVTASAPVLEDLAMSAVGSLTFSDVPHCMALRVNDERLITARHCIYQRDGTLHPALRARRTLEDLRFTPVYGGSYQIVPANCAEIMPAKCPLPETRPPFDFLGDTIELRVVGAPAMKVRPVFASSISVGDALAVIGASAILTGRNGRPFDPTFLAMDPQVGCHVGAAEGPCLYHGCMAVPSFSGSPVIRITGGTPQIVGLHLEGTGASPGCMGASIGRAGNVALRVGHGGLVQQQLRGP